MPKPPKQSLLIRAWSAIPFDVGICFYFDFFSIMCSIGVHFIHGHNIEGEEIQTDMSESRMRVQITLQCQ